MGGTAAPSLSTRLLRRLLVVFALAFAGSCALFLTLSWEQATIEIHGNLRALAEEVAAAVHVAADGGVTLAAGPALRARLDAPALRYAVIEAASGRVVADSTPAIARLVPRLAPGGPTEMAFALAGDAADPKSNLSGFMVERPSAAGPLRVAVATQERHSWPFLAWAVEELVDEVLPVGIPLFLTTLLVAGITIRRTLAPVARLSVEAEAITPRTTGLRLDPRSVPREVLPLVQAFNAALERLDEGFMLQRRFTANAAHQLRTPLAILRARLDGMPALPEVQALKRDCDRLARVVAQLLSIARLEARQIELGETVDLAALARRVVADMAPLAIAQGRVLALDAPDRPVTVRGNSAALADALGNLIDNALRFGAEGQPVEIAVGPGASLAVADRGPGVAPADRPHLFEPFWRGDDPRGAGSGLGLAIVAEIAAAHGGRVAVADRPGGGAVFRLELPDIDGAASAPAARLAAAAS